MYGLSRFLLSYGGRAMRERRRTGTVGIDDYVRGCCFCVAIVVKSRYKLQQGRQTQGRHIAEKLQVERDRR